MFTNHLKKRKLDYKFLSCCMLESLQLKCHKNTLQDPDFETRSTLLQKAREREALKKPF